MGRVRGVWLAVVLGLVASHAAADGWEDRVAAELGKIETRVAALDKLVATAGTPPARLVALDARVGAMEKARSLVRARSRRRATIRGA